jgi:hypothetical protein
MYGAMIRVSVHLVHPTQGYRMSLAANRLAFALSTALLVAAAAIPARAAGPADAGARGFAPGQLRSISELPPGQLKRSIQSLSPQAQANALRWLQKISIGTADYDNLRVDIGGGVFVADTQRPAPQPAGGATGTVTADFAPSDAFILHSKPGAANKVYLDFNGHSFTGTAWGSGTFNALAFSQDGDRTTFSDAERTAIVEIWHRVAEDLAPFDIDVTTEEPASFNSRTGRVLITEDQQANGAAMPSAGAGGVAYVNVFGASNYHTYYSPALVYADNLGPNVSTYIAEASSHEFGHNLGLSHDGTASVAYYAGHGSGLVTWAPIMGNSYYNNVTQWSKGEYTGANQTQDDLAIIAAKLTYRGDDHGNSTAAATALQVNGDGTVDSSNPELDPHNLMPQNKGILNNAADVDVFSFSAGAGTVSFTVNPAWDAFYRATTRRAANVDVGLELLNSAGTVIASNDPTTDTTATVGASVAAGTYYLRISGVGNATVPYSDYNSMGQYFINGSIVPGVADTTAPNPDPMSFAAAPAAASSSSITMTATTATDAGGAVQYRFNCVAGGTGCVASAWQSGASYTATGLAASTSYSYTVQARDPSGNTTAASATASATTLAAPAPQFTLVAQGVKVKGKNTVNLSWTNQPVGNIDVYRNNVKIQSNRTGTTYTDNIGTKGSATYTHKVCTVNTTVCSNTTTTSL